MKTLADLKRDAASGRLSLELVERFGKTGCEIPERLRGVRKVLGANTVALKMLTSFGEESQLYFTSAKLVAYDENTLVIYAPGHRVPTDAERQVQAGAEKLKAEHPDISSFRLWEYYKNSTCPWMEPFREKTVKGKRYLLQEDKVLDRSVRGDVLLRYVVHRTMEDAA